MSTEIEPDIVAKESIGHVERRTANIVLTDDFEPMEWRHHTNRLKPGRVTVSWTRTRTGTGEWSAWESDSVGLTGSQVTPKGTVTSRDGDERFYAHDLRRVAEGRPRSRYDVEVPAWLLGLVARYAPEAEP